MFSGRTRFLPAVLAVVSLLAFSAHAQAQWNERTTMTFSEPVMVPGATLQPGTYVFRLAQSDVDRHTVQILKENGEIVVTTFAVPASREEAKGDTVLKFNPTDEGAPPALAAWFYPGTIYGHQFVYPDEQARKIAQRTKTVVLSTDVPGTDMEQGKLRVYDATGLAKEWKPDAKATASYEKWRQSSSASVVSDAGEAIAPAIDAQFTGTRVELSELEERPAGYIGRTVSVDAVVEDVYGPRLFTIDEPNWGDLDGEILVHVPSPLAAMVREDDRVTISGEVKRFVEADVEREWGWLGDDPDVEVEFDKRPVLVAQRVIGGNNNVAVVIRPNASGQAVGTSGTSTAGGSGAAALTSVQSLREADEDAVGRRVKLTGIRVSATAKDGGFFVKSGDESVFVLPDAQDLKVREGETVAIEGVLLQMPRHMEDRVDSLSAGSLQDDVYIYASQVKR